MIFRPRNRQNQSLEPRKVWSLVELIPSRKKFFSIDRDNQFSRHVLTRTSHGSRKKIVDRLIRLNEIFQEVFDDDEISIDRETTASDVEGWDSLLHVTLLLNIEKAFGVKFTSSEVARLQSVGELIDLIEVKLGH